jgi:hypothetical protein
MDNITNASKDLLESSDEFITGIYKEIAARVFRCHLRKASKEDDIVNGIDYHCYKGSLQFKELKSGLDRSCFDLRKFPFETEAKNRYGQVQGGWIHHTNSDYLVFIRTIRQTKEWKAFVFDWRAMKDYIINNIRNPRMNSFGTAKNQMFDVEEIKDFLVSELNN